MKGCQVVGRLPNKQLGGDVRAVPPGRLSRGPGGAAGVAQELDAPGDHARRLLIGRQTGRVVPRRRRGDAAWLGNRMSVGAERCPHAS